MVKTTILVLLLGIGIECFLIPCYGEEVVLKIQAINPKDMSTSILVKKYLPEGITPSEIIDAGGFEIKYDVKRKLYYVEREVYLKPKASVIFKIKFKDIWRVSEKELVRLKRKIDMLCAPVEWRDNLIAEFKEETLRNIKKILQLQRENEFSKVGLEKHIKTYKENLKLLNRLKMDVEILENLVRGVSKEL